MLEYSADRTLDALGDPTRRLLVARLGAGPTTVSALAAGLPMSMSAVLQQLRVLEAAGVVRSEKVGRVRTCALQPYALDVAERWLAERKAECSRHFDALGAYLDTHPEDE
jgi:DNA-binding transcriptional ArsR family regulator